MEVEKEVAALTDLIDATLDPVAAMKLAAATVVRKATELAALIDEAG